MSVLKVTVLYSPREGSTFHKFLVIYIQTIGNFFFKKKSLAIEQSCSYGRNVWKIIDFKGGGVQGRKQVPTLLVVLGIGFGAVRSIYIGLPVLTVMTMSS